MYKTRYRAAFGGQYVEQQLQSKPLPTSMDELRSLLNQHGLPTSGQRPELVFRYKAHLAQMEENLEEEERKRKRKKKRRRSQKKTASRSQLRRGIERFAPKDSVWTRVTKRDGSQVYIESRKMEDRG